MRYSFSRSSWVAQLGETFTHQGLEVVQFNRYTMSDHNKMWWGLNCCMFCEEYCAIFERESTDISDAAEIQSLRDAIAAAAAAAQLGVVVCSPLVMAVGRKPL